MFYATVFRDGKFATAWDDLLEVAIKKVSDAPQVMMRLTYRPWDGIIFGEDGEPCGLVYLSLKEQEILKDEKRVLDEGRDHALRALASIAGALDISIPKEHPYSHTLAYAESIEKAVIAKVAEQAASTIETELAESRKLVAALERAMIAREEQNGRLVDQLLEERLNGWEKNRKEAQLKVDEQLRAALNERDAANAMLRNVRDAALEEAAEICTAAFHDDLSAGACAFDIRQLKESK